MRRPPAGAAAARRRHERAMAASDRLAEILGDAVGAITARAVREMRARAMAAAGPALVAAGSTFGVDNLPTPQGAGLGALMPAINTGGLFDDAVWTQTVADAEEFIASFVVEEMGVEFGLDLAKEQPLVQGLAAYHVSEIEAWGEEFKARVGRVIDQGHREVMSIPEVTKALREAGVETEQRARLIARTETIGASNGAAYRGHVAIASPGDRKRWMCVTADTALGAVGPCEVARRWHSGQVIRIATLQPGGRGANPSAGRVVGQGAIGDLTVDHLTITPNHPVLTVRGWVRAKSLVPGDQLIGHRRTDRLTADDPDIPDQPALAGEVFSALLDAGPPIRVANVVVDLDGDWSDCQVDVVAADGELRSRMEAALPKHFRQIRFAPPDAQLAKFPGPSVGTSQRLAASGVRPQPSDGCGPLGLAHLRRSQHTGLGLASDRGAGISQPPLHRIWGDAVESGQGSEGRRLVESKQMLGRRGWDAASGDAELLSGASLLDGGGVELEPKPGGLDGGSGDPERLEAPPDCHWACPDCGGDRVGSLPSEVATFKVIEIEVLPFAGHVYDLSTEVGWYCANGLVVANSTSDERTRRDHKDADGQEVPLDQPFVVGNEKGDYPGSGSFSARQRANCRCSFRVIYSDAPPPAELDQASPRVELTSVAEPLPDVAVGRAPSARRVIEGSGEEFPLRSRDADKWIERRASDKGISFEEAEREYDQERPLAKQGGYEVEDLEGFRAGNRAEAVLRSQFDGVLEEHPAVTEYSGSLQYARINTALRQADPTIFKEDSGALGELVDQIQAAMQPLDEGVRVFRGIKPEPVFGTTNPEELVGVVFEDPGFTSTTLAPGRAADWEGALVMDIEVPPGARGVYVTRPKAAAEKGLDEYELILAPGTRFRVVEVLGDNRVRVEVVS